MGLSHALRSFDTILTHGPLGTRLLYDYGFKAVFDLTETIAGRKALTELYSGDISVVKEHGLPIILNALTFRANRNHLQAAGFKASMDIERINTSAINFVKKLYDHYSESNTPIFIGAPLGSMYDAYSVDIIPDVEQSRAYHQEQISIFKKLGVDFVNVVTLSNLKEALGIALAAQESNIDYTIGFILTQNTTLLDGTPLATAISNIDTQTHKKPLGYLITCTHTSVITQLTQSPHKYTRLIGMQPNGSNLPLTELTKMSKPIADSPKEFAKNCLLLKEQLRLKIVGGCCGTTRKHLQEIARVCSLPNHIKTHA